VFTETRKQVISLLNGDPALWSRAARHAIFGPTTLKEIFSIAANHDKAHIQQTYKTI
jgi:hypothetical protein